MDEEPPGAIRTAWTIPREKSQHAFDRGLAQFCLPTDRIPEAMYPDPKDNTFHFSFARPVSELFLKTDLPRALEPAPSAVAPSGFEYPQAKTLILDHTPRYSNGLYYYYDYFPSLEHDTDLQRSLKIVTPPHVNATLSADGKFVYQDIPGMVQLIAGVPVAARINGEADRLITIACYHTLESLRSSPLFVEIEGQVDRLYDLCHYNPIFGNSNSASEPIFTLDGLTRNMRSQEGKEGSFNGSYSLASTIEQVGSGELKPAIQASSVEAQARIREVCMLVNSLYQLIMPLCLLKSEWEILKFRGMDMNVFSLGGWMPSVVSLQMNVSDSFCGGGLESLIGVLQGFWHVDLLDDISCYTFLTMLFQLPEGSDMGAFLLGRSGLYVRELTGNRFVVFLVFKGNDLHSGTSPLADPAALDAFFYDLAVFLQKSPEEMPRVNRVVLVGYTSAAAFQRSGTVAAFPNSKVATDLENSASTETQLNYLENGNHLLGSDADFLTRLNMENFFPYFNRSVLLGHHPEIPTHLLGKFPYHPIHQYHSLLFWRCLYRGLYIDSCMYLVRLSKSDRHRHLVANLEDLRLQVHPTAETDIGTRSKIPSLRGLQKVDLDAWLLDLQASATNKPEWHPSQVKPVLESSSQAEMIMEGSPRPPACPLPEGLGSSLDPATTCATSTSLETVAPGQEASNISTSTCTATVEKNSSGTTGMPNRRSVRNNPQQTTPSDQHNNRQSEVENMVYEESDLSELSESGDEGFQSDYNDTTSRKRKRSGKRNTSSKGKGVSSRGKASKTGTGIKGKPGKTSEETVTVSELVYHDVEKIIDFRPVTKASTSSQGGDGFEYLCQFVGFSSDDNEWIPSWNMQSNALINEFHESCTANKTRPRKRQKRVDAGDSPIKPLQFRLNSVTTGLLDKLFSSDYLIEQKLKAEHLLDVLEKAPSETKDDSAQSILGRAFSGSKLLKDCHELVNSDLKGVTDDFAVKFMLELQLQMESLMGSFSQLARGQALSFVINQNLAKSYIFAYHWFTDLGRRIAVSAFTSFLILSLEDFMKAFPKLGCLVRRICYCFSKEANQLRLAHPSVSGISLPQIPLPSEALGLPDMTVPADLYGLLPKSRSAHPKPVGLDKPKSKVISDRDISVASQEAFMALVNKLLILPGLKKLDTMVNNATSGGKRQSSENDDNVRARAIVRGALAASIADAFDADDAILSCEQIIEVLSQPNLLFKDYDKSKSLVPIANYICANESVAFAEVDNWLSKAVASLQDQDQHQQTVEQLGDAIWKVASILKHGKKPAERRPRGQQQRHHQTHSESAIPPTPPTFPLSESLKDPLPKLEQVTSLIRAYLNSDDDNIPETYRRILRAEFPTNSSKGATAAMGSIDRYSPNRKNNLYAEIVQRHFPSEKLYQETGLSNLGLFMISGQSERTQKHLNGNLFWFESAEDAINHFIEADLLYNSSQDSANYVFEDAKVWSKQPSIQFTITGSSTFAEALKTSGNRRAAFEARIKPLFSEGVCAAWRNWLGDTIGSSMSTRHRTWRSAYLLGLSLRVEGLGVGLNSMQFAHNLANLGMCEPATCEDMIEHISQPSNLQKGAADGLRQLGFKVVDRSDVSTGFYTVYSYLDRHLDDQVKQRVGFGAMFVEHILCKIVRWERAFGRGKSKDSTKGFVVRADDERRRVLSGQESPCPYPAPLIFKLEDVENWVKDFYNSRVEVFKNNLRNDAQIDLTIQLML